MRILILLTAILLMTGCSEADSEREAILQMPERQVALLQAVVDGQDAYKTCPNELKCTAVRVARDKALADAKGDGGIDGWIGQLKNMSTTGSGAAYISVTVPGYDVTLATWNNALSDLADNTLIPFGSPLYEAVAELEEGTLVIFSGQLLAEKSLTEAGSMERPEFVTRFTSIRPVTAADAIPDEGET